MKVISLFNFKGGVAKTVSSVNIATILCLNGKKVLLVDNDPQANACVNLGVSSSSKNTIYELLTTDIPIDDTIIKDLVKNEKNGCLDLIPSKIIYFEAEKQLSHELQPYAMLKNRLEEVKDKYDYVIIDNHPSLSTMSLNGLVASDEVLIPLTPDNFAIEGLEYVFFKLEKVIEQLNRNLKIKGVFLTRYRETNICKEILGYLNRQLPSKTIKTVIRDTVKVGESTTGEPLIIYDKNATASQDYIRLVKEVFNIG